ncbi:serine hydrolase domain-containing protein [Portibacter marinus]|uniref:serine hydrolase domain-containing protein n=1 Tax=Portibacter marinus TaxID=2898660 RepID=UPI001F40F288|nr:serine hydrolase [Portibacter marinus]
MKKFLLLLTVAICYGSIATAQSSNVYFPERGQWERVNSEAFSSAMLDSAVNFALGHEYSGDTDLKIAILKGFSREPYHKILGPVKDRGSAAGVIIHRGKIIKEWGEVDRVDMTFSCTKSYLSTVAGLAFDKDLIKVDEEVAHYLWDGTFEGQQNSKITWRHLLTQSSDWTGELWDSEDWADRPPSEGGIDEWKSRKFEEPGEIFEYNDVRVNVLAYALLNVLRKPLPQVLKEEIMDKIGASSTWRWYGYDNSWVNIDGVKMQSVSGGGHSGGGIFISTMDHARFGYLISNDGKWKNDQLLSSEWMEMAVSPSKANPSYGFMWWLNDKEGSRHMEGINEEVFYAAGFGGNYIVIDKQNELVIVTRWLEPRFLKDFLKMVYTAKK